MRKVVLLGAGATAGTLKGKVPVAADFGEYLAEKDCNWQAKYPNLYAIVKHLVGRVPGHSEKRWGFDKVWGAIDNMAKLRGILDEGEPLGVVPAAAQYKKRFHDLRLTAWGYAGHELRCAVTRVYGDCLSAAIDDAAKGNGTLKQDLKKLEKGDCVISFNYDLLAEGMLKKLGTEFVRSAPDTDSVHNTEKVLLCKPHGSLSWRQVQGGEVHHVCFLNNDAMPEKDVDWCQKLKAHIQPGIIGPVPFKSEIIFEELQKAHAPSFYKLLTQQWSDALQRIKEANELIVLGYGFPDEDLHATYMFADAAARRDANSKLPIRVFEKKDRFPTVRGNIEQIFGLKRCCVKYCGEVKP